MSFNAFKVRYSVTIADPNIPGLRYHTMIFVITNSNNSKFIHYVTGDLMTGIRYERKIDKTSEESDTFHNKKFLGKIRATNYPIKVN
jgi:hypothetical protein